MDLQDLLKKAVGNDDLDYKSIANSMKELATENNFNLILDSKEDNNWIPRTSLDKKEQEFQTQLKAKDDTISNYKTTLDSVKPLADKAEDYKKAKEQLETKVNEIETNSSQEINNIKLNSIIKDVARDEYHAKGQYTKFIAKELDRKGLDPNAEDVASIVKERMKPFTETYPDFFGSDKITGRKDIDTNNQSNNSDKAGSIGKRLAEKRKKAQTQKKSSFFGD